MPTLVAPYMPVNLPNPIRVNKNMIHVEIEEIENGFILKLFSEEGPQELDKTVFVSDSFEKTLKTLTEWYAEVKGERT